MSLLTEVIEKFCPYVDEKSMEGIIGNPKKINNLFKEIKKKEGGYTAWQYARCLFNIDKNMFKEWILWVMQDEDNRDIWGNGKNFLWQLDNGTKPDEWGNYDYSKKDPKEFWGVK